MPHLAVQQLHPTVVLFTPYWCTVCLEKSIFGDMAGAESGAPADTQTALEKAEARMRLAEATPMRLADRIAGLAPSGGAGSPGDELMAAAIREHQHILDHGMAGQVRALSKGALQRAFAAFGLNAEGEVTRAKLISILTADSGGRPLSHADATELLDAMLAQNGSSGAGALSVQECCNKWGTVDGDGDDDFDDDADDEHAGESAALSLLRLPKQQDSEILPEAPENNRGPKQP